MISLERGKSKRRGKKIRVHWESQKKNSALWSRETKLKKC